MPTTNFADVMFDSGRGDWLPAVLLVWTFVWLTSMVSALRREDFDPVTRLTWVLVLILVPFFGVLLYWFVSPGARREPIDPNNQLSGTPWENDPGHTAKGK